MSVICQVAIGLTGIVTRAGIVSVKMIDRVESHRSQPACVCSYAFTPVRELFAVSV